MAYRYDTHVHTMETSPCGKIPAAELVRLYKEAGYDGIVITDHYFKALFDIKLFRSWEKKTDAYLKGYRNALEAGKKHGLDVLFGIEITFTENVNDYLVYGLDEEFLKENRELYKLGLKEFRKVTADKNVLIIQAHPFRPNMLRADPSLLDGVEVYNGNPRHNASNHLSLEFARENKLKMLSGSDFHQIDDLARGGIMLPERITETSQLVEIIKKDGILELIRNESGNKYI